MCLPKIFIFPLSTQINDAWHLNTGFYGQNVVWDLKNPKFVKQGDNGVTIRQTTVSNIDLMAVIMTVNMGVILFLKNLKNPESVLNNL